MISRSAAAALSRNLVQLSAGPILYFLAAWLNEAVFPSVNDNSIIEFQAGLALVWLLLFGWRRFPPIVPCQLIYHLSVNAAPWLGVEHAITELLFVPLAAYLLTTLRSSAHLKDHKDTLALFATTLVSAGAAAVTAHLATDIIHGHVHVKPILVRLWGANFLGALLMVPFVSSLWLHPLDTGRPRRVLEGYIALLLVFWMTWMTVRVDYFSERPPSYYMMLTFVALAWALFRLGYRAPAISNVACVTVLARSTLEGLGPIAHEHPASVYLMTSVYASGVSLVALFMGALIQERRWRTDEFGQNERYFRRLVDSATDNVTVLEVNGVIRYANRATHQISGWDPEELIGKSAFDLIHPDDLPKATAAIAEALKHPGAKYQLIYRWRTKDGRWIYIETTGASLLHDPDVRGIITSSRDITDRQQTLEELSQLLAAIEQTNESIVLTDRDGRIHYVNAAFERTTGYSRQEAIGQNPRILKSGHQKAEFYAKLWRDILSGKPVRTVFINKKKDGTIIYESKQISPMRGASGDIVGFVAVGQDITQQRVMEEQFRQSQKLEAIGRLAGGVAHDFNNLLTVIIGYSRLTLPKASDQSELREALEAILLAGERGADLTKQLLLFSRKQVAQTQVFDMNELLRRSEKMYSFMAGPDVKFSMELEPRLRAIQADAGMMDQVISNLVVNARDAMPGGGTLTLRTLNVDAVQSSPLLSDNPVPATPHIALEVRDTGIGMDEETKAKIYEPFFTTKPKGKGTGLGLPTVYGIVEQAGGSIEVDTAPGKGTTFRVLLPAAVGEAKPLEAVAEATHHRSSGAVILLAEDEQSVRQFTAKVLRSRGYEVLEAADGEEALDIVRTHKGPPIDLLLTDMLMPKMTGRQLADKVKELLPKAKIIIASGYTGELDFLKDGESFLQKPFSPLSLISFVQRTL